MSEIDPLSVAEALMGEEVGLVKNVFVVFYKDEDQEVYGVKVYRIWRPAVRYLKFLIFYDLDFHIGRGHAYVFYNGRRLFEALIARWEDRAMDEDEKITL